MVGVNAKNDLQNNDEQNSNDEMIQSQSDEKVKEPTVFHIPPPKQNPIKNLQNIFSQESVGNS